MSLLLAVDTSTGQAGVALYDGSVRAETIWWANRNHARQLMPTVDRMLNQIGCTPADLEVVAAARGPGSFTGLRVGLAVARGLAFSLEIPLYGIGSLDVVAAGVAPVGRPVRAVLDAGRGRVATALYRPDGSGISRADEVIGADLDGLVRLVENTLSSGVEGCVVVGDLTAEARERIHGLGDRVEIASPAISVRRPGVLAELAWRSWTSGVTPGQQEGEPIYLTRV
jgi:tRNA threonylcarbamoyladenosine biosynthesis protein TsaB